MPGFGFILESGLEEDRACRRARVPLANKNQKVPGCVPGPYYCDLSCIDCGYCRGISPDHFIRNDREGKSIVHRQPITDQGLQECQDAAIGCPASAIGDDGA